MALNDAVDPAAILPIDPNIGGGAQTIIDNLDPSVSFVGEWRTGAGLAQNWYGPNYHYSNPGSGADRFQWPAPAQAGYYAVYGWWSSWWNRAWDAPYTIHHGGGTTIKRVDQRSNGGQWNLLGVYWFDPAAGHKVEMSDDASKFVQADGLRYVAQPDLPPGALIVDNSQATVTGSWAFYTPFSEPYWGRDFAHSTLPSTGGAAAVTWTPTIPASGRYHVYARWVQYANRATDAPYTIHHQYGATEVRVNQEVDGGRWNLLGTFEMAPGSNHRVVLSDDANEYVIADAVMLVPDTTSRVAAADAIRLVANTAEDPLFVHADHLGTPRAMTDGTQTVVWDHVTRPFGRTHSLLGVFENNRRFPGQYFDFETELHYNYFRDYDPALGRYVQSDPIGLDGGLNTYSYVGGRPLKLSDPSGLLCVSTDGMTLCAFPGGPIFKVPTPLGFPETLGPADKYHHEYNLPVPLDGADPDCVADALANNPTPGKPNAATPEGSSNNAVVGGFDNFVTSYLTNDLVTGNPIVVNTAGVGDGSFFGPGYVARYVEDGRVHTVGEGTNWKQSPAVTTRTFQNIGNYWVWGQQMREIVSQCMCTE